MSSHENRALQHPQVHGYVRDPRGTWRYEATGAAVPGAHDLTIRRLWKFPSVGGGVAVPTELLPIAVELNFCRTYLGDRTQIAWQGRRVDAVVVPIDAWADEADLCLGIDAPELAVHRLVDTGRIAQMLGLETTTVRSYVQRGYFPRPTIEAFSFPLWAIPPLVFALRARAGRGIEQPLRRTHRSLRTPQSKLRTPEASVDLLKRLDAELCRLMPELVDEDDFDDSEDLDVTEEGENWSSRYSDV
jgi:hypothetical protein